MNPTLALTATMIMMPTFQHLFSVLPPMQPLITMLTPTPRKRTTSRLQEWVGLHSAGVWDAGELAVLDEHPEDAVEGNEHVGATEEAKMEPIETAGVGHNPTHADVRIPTCLS